MIYLFKTSTCRPSKRVKVWNRFDAWCIVFCEIIISSYTAAGGQYIACTCSSTCDLRVPTCLWCQNVSWNLPIQRGMLFVAALEFLALQSPLRTTRVHSVHYTTQCIPTTLLRAQHSWRQRWRQYAMDHSDYWHFLDETICKTIRVYTIIRPWVGKWMSSILARLQFGLAEIRFEIFSIKSSITRKGNDGISAHTAKSS